MATFRVQKRPNDILVFDEESDEINDLSRRISRILHGPIFGHKYKESDFPLVIEEINKNGDVIDIFMVSSQAWIRHLDNGGSLFRLL